ncbi:MAG: hypothetical protein ACXVFN_06040 [Solirubrobacteraceae bacterium]
MSRPVTGSWQCEQATLIPLDQPAGLGEAIRRFTHEPDGVAQ